MKNCVQAKLLKNGNTINFIKSTDGLEYNLEPNVTYVVKTEGFSDEIYLEKTGILSIEGKIYEEEDYSKFINRTLNYYNNSKTGTTGIMLCGLKGAGKTLMAKQIAIKSNLPIIILDKYIRHSRLLNLFSMLSSMDVCIMIDEFDKFGKDYDNDILLSILDGINTSGKKLVIATCNDDLKINKCMRDRCSRFRYWKTFREIPKDIIEKVISDILNDKDKITSLSTFIIENFKCISFDNIISFAVEVNLNKSESFEDLFKDMNLSARK